MNTYHISDVLRRALTLLLVATMLGVTQLVPPVVLSAPTALEPELQDSNSTSPSAPIFNPPSEINNPPSEIPGWKMTTADPVSPDDARRILAGRMAKRAPSRADEGLTQSATLPASEAESTPEIQALARALQNDPRLIYDYVHNYFDYSPTFGSINGATATMLARRGNDCDQASLFIALMRTAGYTANYVVGDVTYDLARLANWVGVVSSPAVVANVFANGGVPVTVTQVSPSTYHVTLTRIWAQADVGGTTYTFDPAMKEYQDVTGLSNIGAAMGYSPTAFMAHALVGATLTPSYTQDLNDANVRSDLITYTMNLVSYLRANYPTASLDEVLSGRNIVIAEIGAYSTALPYAISVENQMTHSAIPAALQHTLRVQHEGMDHTFKTFEIAGQRVSIFYEASDNYKPVLRVDGAPIVTGTATISGTAYAMTVTVDHPYAFAGGHYVDEHTFTLESGASYIIAHDFNGVSADLIAKHNQLLARYLYEGNADDSEPARGESLWLMGLTYFHEVTLYNQLIDRLGKMTSVAHHTVGVLGQEQGYFMDIPMGASSHNSTDGASDRWVAFRALGMMASAFEHGALEQLQSNQVAVSTIKALYTANTGGDKLFLADSINWASVKAQLVGYTPGELNNIESFINNGYEFVLPQNGSMIINQWRGTGYIQYYQSGSSGSMGMIIAGGYFGGQGTITDTLRPGEVLTQTFRLPADKQGDKTTPESGEPVDMATGAFLYQNADLSIGLPEPLGLHFTRFYNSSDHYSLGPLGYGWSHNYQMSVSAHSNGDPALGLRGAVDAASAIVNAIIALDLLKSQHPSVQEWTVAGLATEWTMEQMIDNALVVTANAQSIEFVRLADGTYNPPPGITSVLTVDAGGFHLQERFGAHFDFDTQGRVTTWNDANDNTLSFAYDGAGKLETVASDTGLTLTLTYNGPLLANVSDSAGRLITYTYALSNLITFRDAMNNAWAYGYDAARQLSSLAAPLGPALMNNVYDEWGRVITQTDALSNTTTFYFSGYRNVERNPDSSQVVHYFDGQVNYVGRQDAQGHRSTFAYDGQGRRTSATGRLNDATRYTYHSGTGLIASLTNVNGDTISYTYSARGALPLVSYDLARVDYPDGTHEQFTHDTHGNVLTGSDRKGQVWRYEYNARGQTTRIVNPAGGIITYTYTAEGALASSQDSDTGITTYTYDGYRRLSRIVQPDAAYLEFGYDLNDRITSVRDENDQLYVIAYDANGNRIRVTDPASKFTQYTVDDMNRVIQAADPLGKMTSFAYDSLGRLITVTDPNSSTVQYQYDSRGWLIGLVDGEGKTWSWIYDDEHTLKSTVTPMGRAMSLDYNAIGWMTTVTDSIGSASPLTYDSLGRLTSMRDRAARQTTYAYDPNGYLQSLTRVGLGTATFSYNGLGQLTELTDFRGQAWSYGYTPMGRLQVYTDTLGNRWQHLYNSRGLLSQTSFPTGESLTLTYDPADNETRWQYSDGTDLRFTYDALGRLTSANGISITFSARGEIVNTQNAPINFGAAYDDGGRLETVMYNNGQFTVTYTYDRNNRITHVEDDLTHNWITFTYNDDGQVVEINRSNGVRTSFTYDGAGRTTRILTQDAASATLADQQFTLNAEGEVMQVIQSVPLDPADLLPDETATLSYDAAGQINSPGYQYDARGRLVAAPGYTFSWDAAERLSRINTTTLGYNGLGDVMTMTQGTNATHYYYNYALAQTPVVAEQDESSGQFKKFYVWTPGGTLLYGIDAAGGNSIFFYHFDQTGSTLLLTNGAGSTTDAYAYTPFGKLLGHTGASAQSFTFVGQYGVQNVADALYHMGRRFYDADSGRFLSRDPVGINIYDPSSLSLYQYAQQDPINVIDPPGEGSWNHDQTVWTGKTGMFVQTQKPHGNFLGGWKWVPFDKNKNNPPPAQPQPPNKPDRLEPKPPPEPPKENPRDTPQVAAKTSTDPGIKPPDEFTSSPPDTGSTNTASVTDSAPPKAKAGNQPPAGPDWVKFGTKQGMKVLQWGIQYGTKQLVPEAFGKGLGTANRLAGVATQVLEVGAEGTKTVAALVDQRERIKKDTGIDTSDIYPGRKDLANAATWFHDNFGFLFK
jgi:RHS repeat-associated protein